MYYTTRYDIPITGVVVRRRPRDKTYKEPLAETQRNSILLVVVPTRSRLVLIPKLLVVV